METPEVVRRRRMVRSFSTEPVDAELFGRLLDDSLRAPSAGNSAGVSWLVLSGGQTAVYWEHTTTPDWRERARRWPGLSRAPVVALSLFSPEVYSTRYAEPDKQAWSGGGGTADWPVPYWTGDAAFAVMTLLLLVEDAGLVACFLGNFRGERALLSSLGVPEEWRLFGAVLVGHPDGEDHRSESLHRPESASRQARIHRGHWQGP